MPRIRCHYVDCVFIDDGYCSAASVEVDPDMGCMTFSRAGDSENPSDWDDEDELEEWDDEEVDVDVDIDDDDLWIDDDDDY
jgi:hypothetical protein